MVNILRSIFQKETLTGLAFMAIGLIFGYTMGLTSHLECARVPDGPPGCILAPLLFFGIGVFLFDRVVILRKLLASRKEG